MLRAYLSTHTYTLAQRVRTRKEKRDQTKTAFLLFIEYRRLTDEGIGQMHVIC